VEGRSWSLCEVKKLTIGLPARPLTNVDLMKKLRHVPTFSGVFMRDQLSWRRRKYTECGIVNLNTTEEPGSHWVAYYVRGRNAVYLDSFGNLRPPQELVDYLDRETTISYNVSQYQPFNSIICGHLCLTFIYLMDEE